MTGGETCDMTGSLNEEWH